MNMRTDHDTSYKQLFSYPELVRELLAGFLPFAWARRLSIDGCTRCNASFASETGRQRHDDMVWRIRTGAPIDDLYVLLEFQSQPDRWMALRMQVYAGLLHQDLLKQSALAPANDLPAVLPLVIYNGTEPWTFHAGWTGKTTWPYRRLWINGCGLICSANWTRLI